MNRDNMQLKCEFLMTRRRQIDPWLPRRALLGKERYKLANCHQNGFVQEMKQRTLLCKSLTNALHQKWGKSHLCPKVKEGQTDTTCPQSAFFGKKRKQTLL